MTCKCFVVSFRIQCVALNQIFIFFVHVCVCLWLVLQLSTQLFVLPLKRSLSLFN